MKIIDQRKPDGTIFEGEEAFKTDAGEVLEVIDHIKGDSIGDIIFRTSLSSAPFVSLTTGNIWGGNLENYTFKLINNAEFILK
jgi:hypothetical protein